MGHSILVYDERHVRMHDVDLVVAVLLLATAWRRSPDAHDAGHDLHHAIDSLERSVMTWSVGYINVELQEIVTSEEVRRGLLRALTAAQDALERTDHFDGVELLRDAFGPEGLTNYTTKAAITAVLVAIRGLLSARDTPPREDA